MRVIGFNFTKLSVEKIKDSREKLKINTEIDVPEIKALKTDLFKDKNEIIEAKFVYVVNYAPDVAKVQIEGTLVFSIEPKIAKQILKEWKKKKINKDFRFALFNVILRKSSVKAIELEEDLNLPLHIPMPSFKKQEDN